MEKKVNSYEKQGMFSIHGDTRKMCQSILEGTIIEKDGQYGVIGKDGKEVLPCIFDQLEILRNTIFGRLGSGYWELQHNGVGTLWAPYTATGFFVRNGKKGWQVDGKEVIPALFDSINHPEGSNYYEVQENGEYRYIDEQMNPVLANVRHHTRHTMPPFPLVVNDKDIITIREYAGQKSGSDSNVVMLDGQWVRLDHLTFGELSDMLFNEADELPLTQKDLALFNDSSSYEYSAFMAKSTEGIRGCLKRMLDMNVNDNSWYYIVKVWCANGEQPKASELRLFNKYIEYAQSSDGLNIAFGHDDKLSAGETKMLIVRYWHEDPIPDDDDYECCE